MILKIKVKKQPKLNDTRIVKRFAFLPIRFNDNEIIWLQFYNRYQIYSKTYNYYFNEYDYKWEDLYDDAGHIMMKLR